MSENKDISPREFADFGYLQEANRLFFHPLGLALHVTLHEPGNEGDDRFGIADWRAEPDGGIMDYLNRPDKVPEARDKADRVRAARRAKIEARMQLPGMGVASFDGIETIPLPPGEPDDS